MRGNSHARFLEGKAPRKGADLLDIEMYLNEAHSQGLRSVRCHCNVMAWAESEAELKRIRNDVGSQLALMGCTPHHNTVDVPVLFWAAIPGNEADFPAEESFYTFLDQALCLFNEETNYRSSLSPFGIKMSDRLSGIPLHLDISDLPMKRGVITNRNKFILGPSGSGKSYLTNHLIRQYWEQGAHILLVDTGNSYQGLCSLIHAKTKGRDGVYFTYTEEAPIAFNPFYVEDGVYDVEKRESLKTLLLTLWEARIRGADALGGGGALERREPLPLEAPRRPLHRPLVRYLLRVRRNRLPAAFGTEARAREGFRPCQFSERTGTLL